MWKRVGIEAELETIEYAKYFELNRGAKLPEATLYSWDNATGDPEIFAGYLLNPKMPFSAWKGMEVGAEGARAVQHRRLRQAHRRLSRRSTRARSRPAPPSRCCRACITVVRKKDLNYAKYGNGWILAQYDGLVVSCSATRGDEPCSARPRESGDPVLGQVLDARFRGRERRERRS